MFDEATTAFLLSGCSLIVGGLTPEGEPFAARGWGVRVAGDDEPIRVLVGAADLERLGAAGGMARRVAVTGADVPTLRSVQLKGDLEAVDAVDAADLAQHRSFCDQFFGDVFRTDGTARHLMERLVPADLVVLVVRVTELFDQTPGPRAGQPLARQA